jgi:hypothetical protein
MAADKRRFTQIIAAAMDGFMAILVPSERTAGRYQFSQQEQSEGGFGFSNGGPPIRATGKKTTTTENLGKQTIEGIEYEGTRVTATAEDQPSGIPIVGVDEQWMAPFGLIGLTKSSGPDMQITAKLRILDRRDPDSALFEIPPNYFIRDLKPDDHAQ